MVTTEKIKIYKKFKGQHDEWSRYQGSLKNIIEDSDWFIIADLLQDLFLISNRLTDKAYSESVEKKIREACDSDETVDFLNKIARDKIQGNLSFI